MGVSWFVALRNDDGRVTGTKTGMAEATARLLAEALNRQEMHPLIDLTAPGSQRLVTCMRWTAHWRLAR